MQAHALAAAFERDSFTHAFASDLQRAQETARIIVARHAGLELVTDARLREFDFGAWEGLSWTEIVERYPQTVVRGATQARFYEPPGGERFSDVVTRVGAFLEDVRSLGPSARLLAVAHAGTLHAVLAALQPKGIDPLGIAFSTASFTRFAMDAEGTRIITLNDVSHLDSTA